MSRIGNKGFTLLEVMVATAVLSLGAALIYESFFISLDSYNYSSNLLNTIPWMDNKIWQAQDSVMRLGDKVNLDTSGELLDNGGKKMIWNLYCSPKDAAGKLYQINLTLTWPQGKRTVTLARSAYATFLEE